MQRAYGFFATLLGSFQGHGWAGAMAHGKILVVEDDLVTVELLEIVLGQEGYSVRTVEDGLGACRAVTDEPPDLILLDLMLPDIDGWELCTMLRTLPGPAVSDTPIIMLTARASREDKLRGKKVGADDYITKPFSPDELLLRIEDLISKSAHRRRGDQRSVSRDS